MSLVRADAFPKRDRGAPSMYSSGPWLGPDRAPDSSELSRQ